MGQTEVDKGVIGLHVIIQALQSRFGLRSEQLYPDEPALGFETWE
jgi:hypothetical protein